MRRKGYKKKCWVYILECKSYAGKITYYTGITNNLERRLAEHKSGKGAKYTRNKKVKLWDCEEHKNRTMASRREREIKRLSQEAKKNIIWSRTPKCPACKIRLISSKARTTIKGSMPVNNGNTTGYETYYSCENNCILNVSSSLLKSYTKHMKGAIK